MDKEYIIFCDESDSHGRYFSNFYGGLIIGSSRYQDATKRLDDLKLKLHFFGEVKWEKVSERYLDKYTELVQAFFNEIGKGNLKVRIMFTHNFKVPKNLSLQQKDLGYFLLYYQFIKHAFGLTYIQPQIEGTRIRLFFDVFPQKKERIEQFKGFLLGLQENEWFKKASVKLSKDNIAEVKSHDHVLLQCLDIVLGSINFRLNDKHKNLIPGTKRRGKKTIAKEQLYKTIYKEITKFHRNFNIGISTGLKGDKSKRWSEPYLHWCFTPDEFTIDSHYAKKKSSKK